MSYRSHIRAFARYCMISCLSLALPAGASVWPEGNYTYYADRQQVLSVLQDFCGTFALTLEASPKVSGIVNGRVQAESAPAFLDRLALAHGFAWFRSANVLHVERLDESVSKRFQVSGTAMAAVKVALREMGVLQEKFGWAEFPAQGSILVSGPRSYVELVAASLEKLDPAAMDWRVAVIRLKHARVDDRTFQERDGEVVIPGVATLLRGLISGTRGPIARPRSGFQMPGAPLGTSAAPGANATKAESEGASAQIGAGVIAGDVRLNALVIRDVPAMLPVYEDIVRQLDVPTSLVQIEAMIVDISKDRLEELGIDWTVNRGRSSATFGNPGITTLSPGTLNLTLGSNAAVDQVQSLLARIRLLEQQGEAKVLSKPMLLTTDNMTALLDLSETFYTRVSGERTANLVPVTAGVMLKVTPHIVSEGPKSEVQLTVDIEDGSLENREGVDLPLVKRSTISTQALIGERQSLLIGGFNSQRNERVDYRVPGLSSLPYVGGLFRSHSLVDSRRERLFLITPTIVPSSGAVATGARTASEISMLGKVREDVVSPSVALDARVPRGAYAPETARGHSAIGGCPAGARAGGACLTLDLP